MSVKRSQGAQVETRDLPVLQVRAGITPDSLNVERRTVDVSWGTGARVRRGGFWTDPFDEELDMSPTAIRMDKLNSGKAPVYDSHQRWGGTAGVKGVVARAATDGKRGTATIRFAKPDADPEAEALFRKIADGIVTGVSVGYRVFKYEKQPKANPLDPNEVPVLRAVDWEPYELSPCDQGADSTAGFRAAEHPATNRCEIVTRSEPTEETEMTTPTVAKNTTVQPAEEATRAAEAQAASELVAKNAKAEGEKLERARAAEIQTIVRRAKLETSFADDLVKNGSTVEAARAAVLDKLAAATDSVKTENHVVVVEAEADKYNRGAVAWLIQKAGATDLVARAAKMYPDKFKNLELDPGEFRGMRLEQLAEDTLERAHVSGLRGMDRQKMIGMAFTRAGGGQSTSDFPVILENTLHKVLLAAYATTPDTWEQFCLTGTVSDFKAHNRYRMGSFGVLDAVNQSGEFKHKAIPDATKQSITAATKGNIIAITRQAIINDDMDVFSRLATMLGRAAKLSIEVDVYALLAQTGGLGPLMADGLPLFDAAHGNIGVGSAITVVGLDADRVLMLQQKDQDGNEYLDLRPSILLVPAGLGATAKVINDAQYDPDTANKLQRPNSMRAVFSKIVDTARISGTRRYLLADPSVAPVVEVAFLDGMRDPYLETRLGWTIDGTEWKVRLDYGVAAIDTKGAITNAGT